MLSVHDNQLVGKAEYFILLTTGNVRFSRLNAVALHYQINSQRKAFTSSRKLHKAETHSTFFFLFQHVTCPPEYSQYINM